MKHLAIPLFVFMLLSTPLSAEAALVNCGTRANPTPCTICHLVQGGVSLMDWGLTIMSAIGIVVIVAMAIMYIVSAGDEGLMGSAKSGIKAALIGFAVMLSAWLIVHTTLRIFGANSLTGYQQGSNVFSFTCSTASSAGSAQAAPQQGSGPIVNNAPIDSDSRTAFVADPVVPEEPIDVPSGSFLVSAAIAGNGSILPAGKAVVSGQTAQFQIVPDSGTVTVSSVTGCGGALAGDIYTTGPITAACTVTVAFTGGNPVTPVDEEGGGGSTGGGGNIGDPGSGNWYPDASNSKLLVVDPPTGTGGSEIANGIMYIPGCVGTYNDGSPTGCRVSPTTPSGGIGGNFRLSQGNTLSIRMTSYADSSSITSGAWLGIQGPDGGGFLSNISLWLVTDPRTSYVSAPSKCKMTASNDARVLTNSQGCPITSGQTYYLNIRVNDANKCGPKPANAPYYSGDCNLQLNNSSRTLK